MNTSNASAYSRAMAAGVLLVNLCVAACASRADSAINTVELSADSPDRTTSAILVRHSPRAALNNDLYHLLVVPAGVRTDTAKLFRKLEDAAALTVTWGKPLKIEWPTNGQLEVICADCGLENVDITKRLDHVGNVGITYVGFPPGTAYSR